MKNTILLLLLSLLLADSACAIDESLLGDWSASTQGTQCDLFIREQVERPGSIHVLVLECKLEKGASAVWFPPADLINNENKSATFGDQDNTYWTVRKENGSLRVAPSISRLKRISFLTFGKPSSDKEIPPDDPKIKALIGQIADMKFVKRD